MIALRYAIARLEHDRDELVALIDEGWPSSIQDLSGYDLGVGATYTDVSRRTLRWLRAADRYHGRAKIAEALGRLTGAPWATDAVQWRKWRKESEARVGR